MSTWSAPVRYAEVDRQGVVFNSHYLLYCDEAMSAWCRERDMLRLAERVQLVASTIAWKSGAKWGEQLTVDMRTKEFSLRNVDGRFRVDETGTIPL